MKILVHPVEAWGHINACIGMSQLMSERGHRIVFVVSTKLQGQFLKYGFEERILHYHHGNGQSAEIEQTTNCAGGSGSDHGSGDHVEELKRSALFTESDPLKKYGMFYKVVEMRGDEILRSDDQLKRIIDQERPDLILVDQIIMSPVILCGSIPWCNVFSCNPICFRNDPRIPPPFSGLPMDDPSQWPVYREEFTRKYHALVHGIQNRLLQHYGHKPIQYDGITPPSPYMNIYGYPEELDYVKWAPMPSPSFRIDTFCRREPDQFALPKEFLDRLPATARLIYISLGTLASIRSDILEQILVTLFRHTGRHFGYIVSMGEYYAGGQLPDNVYGAPYVPQTKILPMVDLVITHGGNNTVTEALMYGKPMIVMPFFVDQYDNAQRIQETGYGIRLDPFNIDPDTLVAAVDRLLDDGQIRKRLEAISQRIRQSQQRLVLCQTLETLFDHHHDGDR